MARKIVVDPGKLVTASQKMEAQSKEYERLYKQLYNEVDSMGSAWQGVDNQAYVTQIKGFMDDFQKMVKLMDQYSEFLTQAAKVYKDTQSEVISSAKKLTN